jgi:histidinol-phosphate phosphatase family protein
MANNRYIVFDRDGTLIEYVPYLAEVSEVRLKYGVSQTLAALKNRGFRFGVATNQSVIGRGLATLELVNQINSKMIALLNVDSEISFDFVRLCPHLPEDFCKCRKPRTGLLSDEIKRYQIDCSRSFMIGDSLTDMEFGSNLGMQTVLINNPRLSGVYSNADWVIENFFEILDIV